MIFLITEIYQKINLNSLINLCVDLIKVQCYEKKLNLNIELPSETIIVIGDKIRFYNRYQYALL
ncbi:unnamed protein product [Paramecium sonneborni]|uniref:Uncharacterized protein n=1 Tax=Paramecium sonneborni TaxID=65129 RepID=A0A8S1MZ64_9CILI|nr:unnamed protein product [Paramecium sonneborni]